MKSKIVPARDAEPLGAYMSRFTEDAIANHGNAAGAVITFTGTVREDCPGRDEGIHTTGIHVECIEEVALEVLDEICNEMKQRHGVVDVVIVHFHGDFNVGDPMVHVLVLARHRQEGFAALQDTINAYKQRAPLWKKELYSDGTSRWIHH